MTGRSIAIVSCLALALAGCATAGPGAPAALASASLSGSDGTPAGTASIHSERGLAVLRVAASGLTPGVHGIHLHAVGKCEGPGFTSAGGHLNPAGRQHGTLNPAGSHLGDLPNLEVRADGTAALEFRIGQPQSALRGELFDADGTAVVIHAGPDDYRSDPAGNSGGRIACGVFAPG
jgi:Cu-Zn family superoxide dismutase